MAVVAWAKEKVMAMKAAEMRAAMVMTATRKMSAALEKAGIHAARPRASQQSETTLFLQRSQRRIGCRKRRRT